MKNNTKFIEVDREVLHSLLWALTLVRLKGKKINKLTSSYSEPIEVWPGVSVVEKKQNKI